MAGKVDVCLFDKTGTLTTDELVAVGVEAPNPSGDEGFKRRGSSDRSSLMDTLVTMLEAPAAATLVLAGCQSLVLMEGSEAGDPVEAAAMKSLKVGHLMGLLPRLYSSLQCLVKVLGCPGTRSNTFPTHLSL